MTVNDEIDDCVVFLAQRPVDLVVLVFPHHRFVSRNIDDFQLINFGKFAGLGHGRTGHAGKLGIYAE